MFHARFSNWLPVLLQPLLIACSDDGPSEGGTSTGGTALPNPKNPDAAEVEVIDRFSEDAATLMIRTADSGLPGANEPIDYDMPPFITQGLGPSGQIVRYYNFDVQPTEPAPIYVLFAEGAAAPVADQLNVVNVVPGDAGYSDFWRVVKVTVPAGYEENSITSAAEIVTAGLEMEETDMLVNCPIVPDGSTAMMRMGSGSTGLVRGWYAGKIVYYFGFEEAHLMTTSEEMVPTSPIYVTFNQNPPEGGPQTGFVVEDGSEQTHNVVATIPSDAAYSPLWSVQVYDNAAFPSVSDLPSAQAANVLAAGVANVNCPVVSVE